jgi:hypothetical protein
MSSSSKVAIAIDFIDWPRIEPLVKNVTEAHMTHDRHVIHDRPTPDNFYRCIYWDDVCWSTPEAQALENALSEIRHSFISISEDGNITIDNVESDERGIDEEFSELLSWSADICFWDDGVPLAPVSRYTPRYKQYVPISRERAIQILTRYVENDMQAAELGYIYDALTCAGADHADIRALGFGYCIPSDEEE